MESSSFKSICFKNFKWLNKPKEWYVDNNELNLITGNKTDFWQGTWYNFHPNTGHVFGVEIKDDFTLSITKKMQKRTHNMIRKINLVSIDGATFFGKKMSVVRQNHSPTFVKTYMWLAEICVEAEFTTLYDQAGLMIYLDEKHWLKAGIEYNDGQPMISSVLTNEVSDWATGIYPGNPKKFYIRMTKKGDVICVKYSTDNISWTLLRLCSMPVTENKFIGPMACTPQREGLRVKFSGLSVTVPDKDILHSN